MMIIIIRHATPLIDYGKCGYKVARKRLIEYNRTSKIDANEIDIIIKKMSLNHFKRDNLVGLISTFPRASVTSEYISQYIKFRKEYNRCYQEFDLNIAKIPLVKLKIQTWFLISRLAWFAGLNAGAKSFKNEKLRAKECAKKLELIYEGGEYPILIGHGLFNRFVEKQLRSNNWKINEHHQKNCFEIKKFERL